MPHFERTANCQVETRRCARCDQTGWSMRSSSCPTVACALKRTKPRERKRAMCWRLRGPAPTWAPAPAPASASADLRRKAHGCSRGSRNCRCGSISGCTQLPAENLQSFWPLALMHQALAAIKINKTTVHRDILKYACVRVKMWQWRGGDALRGRRIRHVQPKNRRLPFTGSRPLSSEAVRQALRARHPPAQCPRAVGPRRLQAAIGRCG